MKYVVEIEYSGLSYKHPVKPTTIVSGSRSKVFQSETWARRQYNCPRTMVRNVYLQHLDVVVRRLVKEWVEPRPDVNVFHRDVLEESREPLNLW